MHTETHTHTLLSPLNLKRNLIYELSPRRFTWFVRSSQAADESDSQPLVYHAWRFRPKKNRWVLIKARLNSHPLFCSCLWWKSYKYPDCQCVVVHYHPFADIIIAQLGWWLWNAAFIIMALMVCCSKSMCTTHQSQMFDPTHCTRLRRILALIHHNKYWADECEHTGEVERHLSWSTASFIKGMPITFIYVSKHVGKDTEVSRKPRNTRWRALERNEKTDMKKLKDAERRKKYISGEKNRRSDTLTREVNTET